MKRNLFVMFELLLMIITILGIAAIIFSAYYIFKGIGRSVINVNNDNREIIEYMLKKSEYYNQNYDIKSLKKIQFFMDFNDYQFTLYYENNEDIELYDDDLYDLKEYIKRKGYSKSEFYIFIDAIIAISCVCINVMRKKISRKIDYLDKIK